MGTSRQSSTIESVFLSIIKQTDAIIKQNDAISEKQSSIFTKIISKLFYNDSGKVNNEFQLLKMKLIDN